MNERVVPSQHSQYQSTPSTTTPPPPPTPTQPTHLEAMPPSSHPLLPLPLLLSALQNLGGDVIWRAAHGPLPLPGARHAGGQPQIPHLEFCFYLICVWVGGSWFVGCWCWGCCGLQCVCVCLFGWFIYGVLMLGAVNDKGGGMATRGRTVARGHVCVWWVCA
jgi:hypothetical protein